MSDHQTKTNLEWKLLKRVFRNLQQRRLLLISTSLIQISMKKKSHFMTTHQQMKLHLVVFFSFSLFPGVFLATKSERKKQTSFFCINGCETFLWCETRMTSSVAAAAAVLLAQSDSASFLLLVLVFLSSAHNWESHLNRLDSFFPPVSRQLATDN